LLEVRSNDAHVAELRSDLGQGRNPRTVNTVVVRYEDPHAGKRCRTGAKTAGAPRAGPGRIVRAVLLYNATAGTAASEEAVRTAVDRLGWKVERFLTKKELDGLTAYSDIEEHDVVVVAGGDGTIGKAAKRLAGRKVPMVIVPMGTANNIARSLGLGVDPVTALEGLKSPVSARLDLGVVEHRGSREFFVEGFGIGVFADVIAEKASKKDKTIERGLKLISSTLKEHDPNYVELEVDGADVSGDFVFVAVMNAQCLGPALCIAPGARCDDGLLEIVLVRPEHKAALSSHLARTADGDEDRPPAFETLRGTRIKMRADGLWAHVDDCPVKLAGPVSIQVAAGAVRLLAPSLARGVASAR
jgi:diacylglycerol kinase family enzyme